MLFKTSSIFKENLEQFPSIEGIEKIELYQDDVLQGTIENIDGQKGSLALYHYLFKTMGTLDLAAARRGLELFAEHTSAARATPGAHPNIDRLILIEATHKPMTMTIIYNADAAPTTTWDDDREEQ
ncbi:DUF2322 family protein [Hydromonas duriensis]|uniref:DUF2322 family protein n=1 Tax=Hydromonas duriensis TaxID=1527608 RepID=A0A4R6Y3I1_9BURK|nr:DUF2322 family protein [Hydromonas duriensis]TDR30918.1 hypothetical protein DFR44_11534 [Hydromonas duriensis]